MSTSAFESNKKGQKGLAFFETSDTHYITEYGLYNSTGQLLKGNELFEQYSELAKQLDTKRSAFYLQLKEKEIIFGCSLIVKAVNGREERVIFIQVYKDLSSEYKIESNIALLKRFYEAVQSEIETLELEKYQLIGLWNEGDFQNIKNVTIDRKDITIDRCIKYTLGKISADKKVSIKISELSSGLSLILELVARLRESLPLIFDVSQYPSVSDVSVSLIKSNPDFELGENGYIQNFTISESWTHYEKLGEKLFRKGSCSNGGQNRSDYISNIVQMILDEPRKYCDLSNLIFNDSDDGEKVEIFIGLIKKLNNKNYDNIRKVLINIYGKIEASKSKKDIQIILFSNNIYIKEIIKDLITATYKNKNKDFFDILFNTDTPHDNLSIKYSDKNNSEYSFENGVKDVLKDLEYSQKVDFVKFIARNARSKPGEKGTILLDKLVKDLVLQDYKDFILQLNDEELEKLDEILGTNHLSTKKEQKTIIKNWFFEIIYIAGLLLAIIFLAAFYIHFYTGFFFYGDSGDNIASDNVDNFSNTSGTDLGKLNNLSSYNQTSNSNLNNTDLVHRFQNKSLV